MLALLPIALAIPAAAGAQVRDVEGSPADPGRDGASPPPNIVLVLADDLGYGDVGCYNRESKIPTPSLDRLAREGIRFTDAHSASAVCTPTRYALLTGRYAWRTRLERGVLGPWGKPLIERGRLTVASLLRERGYATACIGKWHLGWTWPTRDGEAPASGPDRLSNVDFTKPIADGPTTVGFDLYFGTDVPNYPPYCFIENDRTVGIPSVPDGGRTEGFNRPGPMLPGWKLVDVLPELTRRAVRWIEDAAGAGKPFFLYFPLTSPHYPVVPAPEFEGTSGAGEYGDFVVQTDWTVGQVLDALERTGAAGNTLVIFTSDNGPEITGEVDPGAYDRAERYGHFSMGGLRGAKRDAWEGGHRVPFLARWPGRIGAGSVSDETIGLVDFTATVAALIGAALPARAAEDSYDILPALLGERRERPIREATVHHSASGKFAIRRGDWVLIDAPTGDDNRRRGEPAWFRAARGYATHDEPGELFNLREDLPQRRNLYAEQPERVRELAELLARYRREGRSAPAPASPPAARRPDVVLVVTDDQGWGDLGVHGNPVISTPHIDAMARRSATVERFYVSPVCAPTRACLMTGRYNYRTRAIDTFVGRAMMEPEEVTVAEVLRGAGYATGIFGKWHLGDCHPMRPIDQGFDEALVHRGGGIGQPSDPPGGEGKYTDPVLFANGVARRFEGYCTDVYFDAALRFLEKNRREGRSSFAYIPTNAPHGPYDDVPEELYEKYRKLDLAPVVRGRAANPAGDLDRLARIFAMIEDVDENVGRLFARLGELGAADDTLVFFMVDNGPNTRRYVGALRGMKTEVHEGGIRSPLFVHWPARLRAGRSVKRIAAHIDLMPTILDACGVAAPAGIRLDGRSLLPLLEAKEVEWPERTLFIQSHRGDVPVRHHHFAAVGQRWKLVNPSGFGAETLAGAPRFELYDLERDPGEARDLASERPEVVERLRRAYDAWFDDVGSTRPDNYAPPRISVGTPHENPVVLTRQDWRHAEGRPWGQDSNGYWLLRFTRGTYDVRLRFRALEARAAVTLAVAGKRLDAEVAGGATEHRFESIAIDEGEAELRATLSVGGETKGPWQVEVLRR